MYFRDRPLLVDGLDSRLVVRRELLEDRVVTAVSGGRNALVLGEPGSGKSTLLRIVAEVLRQRGDPFVLVNAAVAEDTLDLLRLVDDAMDGIRPGPVRKTMPEDASYSARLLDAARRLMREEPIVVLLDGLDESQTAFDLFGRLRDELWSTTNPWVVAVRTRDSAVLRTPPVDAFWSVVIEISPFSDAEIEALLMRGLDPAERQVVRERLQKVEGFPRAIIRDVEAALAGGKALSRVSRHSATSNERIGSVAVRRWP